MLRLLGLRCAVLTALAFAACAPLPVALPALSATQDAAVRSTLAAAASTSSSISIPDRPCPEHSARAEPGSKCKPLPCGGQCHDGQLCDETAIVPRCVSR